MIQIRFTQQFLQPSPASKHGGVLTYRSKSWGTISNASGDTLAPKGETEHSNEEGEAGQVAAKYSDFLFLAKRKTFGNWYYVNVSQIMVLR